MVLPCVAPLATPPPIPNATLLSLFLFTRHGARTSSRRWEKSPERLGTWECGHRHLLPNHRTAIVNGVKMDLAFNASQTYSFPPSCDEGALLDEGFDQHVSLGKLYRRYLVDNTRLLPEKFNPDLVQVRASHYKRCVESAVGFMQGLYEPEGPGEELNITTGNETHEVLCPFVAAGPEFVKAAMSWSETDEFKEWVADADEVVAALNKDFNITYDHIVEYLLIGGYFMTYKCHGDSIEPVDDALYAKLIANMAYFEAGYLNYSKPLGDAPIWKLVFDEVDSYYGLETQTKFSLFSGHDVTLAALLVSLGLVDYTSPPPFASHLAVEVWYTTRPHIRIVYNGQVVPVNGRDLTPLSEFKASINTHTPLYV